MSFPLVDVVHQFGRDVQGVRNQFEEKAAEETKLMEERISETFKAQAEESPMRPPAAKRSGSGSALSTPRLLEPSPAAPMETAQASPRPKAFIAAASPRKGGTLLDAMRLRGTLAGAGAPSPCATRLPNADLVPKGNIVASKSRGSGEAPRAASQEGRGSDRAEKAPVPFAADTPRPPKRARDSIVSLYKACVDDTISDKAGGSTTTSLKGKIEMAKKFRRSSMLKQAASNAQRALPTPVVNIQAAATATAASRVKSPAKQVPTASPVKATPASASSAVSPARIAGAAAFEGMATPASPASAIKATTPGQDSKRPAKKPKPTVPQFKPTWLLLRETPLSPKKAEDNYEMSDKDEDSEGEEPDRSHKYVPGWCKTWLETVSAQSSWDPDTIFGKGVPQCDLDSIFSLDLYKQYSRERPKRKRGSSGQWQKDRLRSKEVEDYKRKMGQTKPFSTELKNAAQQKVSV